MKLSKDATILEATRLTRSGKLQEAVDLIQRTLRGVHSTHPNGQVPTRNNKAAALEGEYQVLPDEHVAEPGIVRDEARQGVSSPRQTKSSGVATPTMGTVPPHKPWMRSVQRMPFSHPGREPEPLVKGAQFISGSYANSAGTRSYKLYVPSSYQGQALPLVVMLHGCTQDPDDFAAGTRMNTHAERQQCLVLYPAQAPTANSSKCWNWFMAGDQRRDQGEPSIIAGMTRQILDSYRVAFPQIYIAGLSAGGAMALVMAMTYPELFAAVGVHSGLPYAVAHDLPTGLALMGPNGKSAPNRHAVHPGAAKTVPAIVFHGDQDTTVHPRNADHVIAQCAPARRGTRTGDPELSVHVESGQVPQGYAYTRTRRSDPSGTALAEQWLIHGAGHAWSGGSARGSYTDPQGPDATQEMLRFFTAQSRSRSPAA